MSKYQSVFKRYEKKYLLSEEQYRLLRQRLESKLKVDKYGQSTLCNVYYDTPDHRLIRASLEKPYYKEKLRLRSYGKPQAKDTVFVELKKKYNGVVYKRRTEMPLQEALTYLCRRSTASNPSQITKEIDWFLRFYEGIRPSMYISYDRLALFGIEDTDLRITFDTNILWREVECDLRIAPWGSELLAPGQHLMEIKIAGAMPLWLAHLLDELKIYPQSYSKYGRAYQSSQCYQTYNKGGKTIA